MGNQLFDQYTYLHFAVGIIVYFWNISLLNWVILHTIFEFIENTQIGMNIINAYIVFWPGCKPKPDFITNTIGDTFGAIFGWVSAYWLDDLGNTYGWYTLHIK
jgi:hypothetical protein